MSYALILLCAAAAAGGDSAKADKPNFVIINVDDLGYADIGPFGSNNRTPHLDRMAREGRKLLSHYAAPVCSPSRAALMTGCYPKRVLPIPLVLFPAAAVGLHPDEVTIAEVLKDAGYATGCFGKWHLGDQPEFLPTRQGFDQYFGIPYSNDMGPPADGTRSNVGKHLPQQAASNSAASSSSQSDEFGIRGLQQPPLPLMENDKVIGRIRVAEQQTLTRQVADRAVEFIRTHRQQPFFLYLPFSAVHWPLYPAEEFRGESPNGLLGDWVEEVDAHVGHILDTLRELELANNTLVIFTSDNGGPHPHGAKNTPLRGFKTETYEGGVRVCTIAWWPGKIPAGTSTDAITTMMDLLPTFAHLSAAALPAARKIDGVNIWPILAGATGDVSVRDHFYYYRGLRLQAVRQGTWKLRVEVDTNAAGATMLRPRELFNLADDVGEQHNRIDDHPQIVEQLLTLCHAVDADLGISMLAPGCRPLGRVDDPQPLIDHAGKVRPDAIGSADQFP